MAEPTGREQVHSIVSSYPVTLITDGRLMMFKYVKLLCGKANCPHACLSLLKKFLRLPERMCHSKESNMAYCLETWSSEKLHPWHFI
jgi:hypothetical protein